MRLATTILLTGWLGLTSSVAARDIFVNNVEGDDRRSGRWPTSRGPAGGPFRTIARALRSAAKGDRIILAGTDQPYRESITLQGGRHSGFDAAAPFVIQGNGAAPGCVPAGMSTSSKSTLRGHGRASLTTAPPTTQARAAAMVPRYFSR